MWVRNLSLLLFVLFLYSCQPRPVEEVRIRLPQDPELLNPVNYTTEYARQTLGLLFQGMLTVDLADGQLKPCLSDSMPAVEIRDSVSLFTYTIRPEAHWDNGSPVTAADVAFTLKSIKCPLLNNERIRLAYDFIRDIKTDEENARQFTLICRGYTPEMLLNTGELPILPAYLFDPDNRLAAFSVRDFTRNPDSLSKLPDVIAFATQLNSDKFGRDPALVRGSGGYELTEWKTGQYLKLRRKERWWADQLPDHCAHISARPVQINFQIIPDNTSALMALQRGDIDVYSDIPTNEFIQLKGDKNIARTYGLHTPETHNFVYAGINGRQAKFADRHTRQALAHLFDTDNLIKAAQQGFAVRTVGPITPANRQFYNASISPYTFDLARAAELLKKAGWRKENGRWVRYVSEQAVPLTISVQYRAGNTIRENIALIFKQAAAQLEIPVEVQPVEGKLLNDNLRNGRFEMFIGGISGNPFNFDFHPIYHSESAANGGGNYTHFGTAESDSLIEAISLNADERSKAIQLKRLQEILHEESNIIYLFAETNRIAISNRFTNAKVSSLSPGYDVTSFTAQSP